MSCEGCRDQQEALETTEHFGEHLADTINPYLSKAAQNRPVTGQIKFMFDSLLSSLGAAYSMDEEVDRIWYSLEKCPFLASADQSGFDRGLSFAYSGFGALCQRSLECITADWILHYPSDCDQEGGLLEFVLTKKEDQ